MAYERVDELRQRDAAMEDKLSFGSYMGKQLRTMGILLASTGVGAFTALGIGKMTGKTHFSLGRMGGQFFPEKLNIAWIGGFIGNIVGGYFSTYEHWAKNEATNLSVAEINKDIATARLRIDPELKRENLALRDLVKQQAAALEKRGLKEDAPAALPMQSEQQNTPTAKIAAETAEVNVDRLSAPQQEQAIA